MLRSDNYLPRAFDVLVIEVGYDAGNASHAPQVQHRLDQLIALGILPQATRALKSILTQRYHGDITIVPDIALSDYLRCSVAFIIVLIL